MEQNNESSELTFEQLIKEHGKWANATFPKGTSLGALAHAKREIEEVEQELNSQEQDKYWRLCTEYADVLFCVMDSARRANVDLWDIIEKGRQKLEINKSRQWRDNGDGSYSHIKNTEQ